MKNDSKNDVELVDGDGYISDESSFYGKLSFGPWPTLISTFRPNRRLFYVTLGSCSNLGIGD